MKGLDKFCNHTVYPYVYNLTSSYTDQKNEATMVTTTVAMFMLAVFFFNLNLFSRLSDVSAILNPSVRLLLSTALSLFLPVMSYLFSEAKNQGAASTSSSSYGQLGDELSLRARTILMWMLLVELLRKKVEAVLVNVGMQWYSSTIDRFARIVWLGYLVFYNVKSPGKKAIYGTLWVLTAAKFLQRVVAKEVLERSFTYGRNIQLLNSYMAQQIIIKEEEEHVESGSRLLKECKYTVMGEGNLERTAGRHGYQVKVKKEAVVTVGDIWTQAAAEPDSLLLRREHLRRLCLSFALYKLLRRRFEDIPITREETRNCQNLIFKGMLKEEAAEQGAEVALFQVLNDETQFVCEYYHSVLPVVLSSPFFFLANYILFPIVVWAFCLLTFIISGNGNVPYAYHSIASDNYIIDTGPMTLARCLVRNIIHSPQVLFASIDLGTTTLLILAFIYEEVVELLVFIFSNWLIVSLLCKYTACKLHGRQSRIPRRLIRGIVWVRSMLSQPNLRFKQLSVLGPWLSSPWPLMVPTKAVPKEVMKSIVDYLVSHLDVYGGVDGQGHDADRLNSAWSSTLQLEKHRPYRPLLLPVCQSKSVAEFILTCHIATSLMEARYPQPQDEKEMGYHHSHSKVVATTLSKYCNYLVAFYPGLLPEDKNGTQDVYKKMKEDMKKELGGCSLSALQGTKYKRLTEIGKSQQGRQGAVTSVVHNGAKFGTALIEKAEEDNEARERVWELLADLWTELMVYVAPSAGDLHVKAHKEALARGGEFITVLWVLCTHTGMTRPDLAPWDAAHDAFV